MRKIKLILMILLLSFLVGCENNVNNKEDQVTEELVGKGLAVGIWHRPNVMGNETSIKGIEEVLDTFSKCGINIVYLETVYHGMAVYKSNYLPYYTGFSNYNYGSYRDYLDAFTALAKKRNIEVHAWVEDFYIGITEGVLAKSHPDWLLKTKDGSIFQKEGNGYIFLDPANTSVQDFLVNVYAELLTNYPNVLGLNLDYIRYPVSSKESDTGYTLFAMKDYLKTKLVNVDDDKVEETFNRYINRDYDSFTKYRADKVTAFVKKVRDMVDTKFDNIILSTAVFPNEQESYNTKKQDFTTWFKNNYLDVVTPMAYYDDNSALRYYLNEMVSSSNNTYCYSGISSIYHSLSKDMLFSQIDICLELSDGFVIFGSQKLLNNEMYISALNERFKSLQYHLPHKEGGKK